MRFIPVIMFFAGATFQTLSPTAAIEQSKHLRDCNSTTLDRIIKGCSSLIKSGRLKGKSLSTAYYQRAVAHQKKRQYDRAMEDFDKAIELNPKEDRFYANRGATYARMGDRDKAIADLQQALKIDPNNKLAKKSLKDLEILQ